MDLLIGYTKDVQSERNKDSFRDVFVHDGFWKSGLVAVIINYSVLPNPIGRMAQDCTAAVVWVQTNIFNYGGNPDRIFLMGHSAGGHLIGLINSDRRFFRPYGIRNPIYGIILLDAFGLDMYGYLSHTSPQNDKHYDTFIQVFSNDPQHWKRASPMKYWRNIRNPQLILIGQRTYPAIQTQNRDLYRRLVNSGQVPVEFYEIPRRNHSEIVIYMFFSSDEQYDIILDFIRTY